MLTKSLRRPLTQRTKMTHRKVCVVVNFNFTLNGVLESFIFTNLRLDNDLVTHWCLFNEFPGSGI